jgi:hypothetical protein
MAKIIKAGGGGWGEGGGAEKFFKKFPTPLFWTPPFLFINF